MSALGRLGLAGAAIALVTAVTGTVLIPLPAAASEPVPSLANGDNPACPNPEMVALQAEYRFSDLTASDPHAASIGCIAYYGISLGAGNGSYYDPNHPVPRWQMALFMSRAAQLAGVALPSHDMGFTDLDDLGRAARDGVNAVALPGIMPGRGDGRFVPADGVTRADMARILTRLLAFTTGTESPINLVVGEGGRVTLTRLDGTTIPTDHPFNDLDGLGDPESGHAIGALYALGVTLGTGDGAYRPGVMVNRAQMASFIIRALGHTDLRPAGLINLKDAPPDAAEQLAIAFEEVTELRQAPSRTCMATYLNNDLVFEKLSGEALLPASLTKVVTGAIFLDLAGPDSRFTTEVFVKASALEAVTDGVLTGDLYLVGGGDPVLSTPRYAGRYPEPRAHTDITELANTVADSLNALGITTINGGVIADESRFPDEERDYADMRLSPDADRIWKPSNVAVNLVGPLSALLLNDGFSSYSYAVTSEGRRANIRAADPARLAAEVFDDLLEARGFVIRQRTGKGVAPGEHERKSLGVLQSPPAHEIVTRMLRFSDNTTAEMLFKEIGRLAGTGSAWEQAMVAANAEMLRLVDLPDTATAGAMVVDGSGLSYSNRLTCRMVAELLRRAGPGSPLVEGLAVAGESGTLRTCLPSKAATNGQGELRAKTGTLNDSTALAGITVARNGDVVTFAMIANRPWIYQSLGFCNVLGRAVMDAALGHPYGGQWVGGLVAFLGSSLPA